MEPNAAEWLSAWSTFWGAIAAGVGAIGTAGALWLGAVTFRRQVNDQHRAQAAAVTVTVQRTRQDSDVLEFSVQNDSSLPIYEVMLIASDRGRDVQQEFVAAMPPRTASSFQLRDTGFMGCRAAFYDSSGKRWVRHFNGHLKDITPKRTSRLRLLYIALTTHDPSKKKLKQGE